MCATQSSSPVGTIRRHACFCSVNLLTFRPMARPWLELARVPPPPLATNMPFQTPSMSVVCCGRLNDTASGGLPPPTSFPAWGGGGVQRS